MGNTSRKHNIYIIGNGPSVKINDLDALREHQCIAVNRFHLSYSKHSLRPATTFCIDPQMIDDHICEIAKKCGGELLVPRQFALKTLRKAGLKAAGIRFFPFDRGTQPLRFSFDINTASGNGASVVFSALQYAASKKPSNIFLYGVDHHFIHNPPDSSGKVQDEGEKNHFIDGYRQPSGKWFPPDIKRIEAAFRLAKQECDRRGIKIWNATHGGKLEIFDRINFDKSLEKFENIDGL